MEKSVFDFSEEARFWRRGHKFVVGLDEVGRGSLAGPVCAAAVCLVPSFFFQSKNGARRNIGNVKRFALLDMLMLSAGRGSMEKRKPGKIRDSKKLSASQRERWYKFLAVHPGIEWGIGFVSAKTIDRINILAATKLAMRRALDNLRKKGVLAEYLLLDGNFLLDGLSIDQKAVVRGDEKIWSCAAASIIAKVTRDRLMRKYHQKFPLYGFDRHVGYGTRRHVAALRRCGQCSVHRKSFHWA